MSQIRQQVLPQFFGTDYFLTSPWFAGGNFRRLEPGDGASEKTQRFAVRLERRLRSSFLTANREDSWHLPEQARNASINTM